MVMVYVIIYHFKGRLVEQIRDTVHDGDFLSSLCDFDTGNIPRGTLHALLPYSSRCTEVAALLHDDRLPLTQISHRLVNQCEGLTHSS